jgi:hypothetical protein
MGGCPIGIEEQLWALAAVGLKEPARCQRYGGVVTSAPVAPGQSILSDTSQNTAS